MEPQNQNKFTTVTKLSKALAAVLFVVLPFIGLYIGYTYAPEKVVEVERVVEKVVVEQVEVEKIVEVIPEDELSKDDTADEVQPSNIDRVEEAEQIATEEALSEPKPATPTIQKTGKLQYFYAAGHFEYIAEPECGPFNDTGRGPFSIDAGDGNVYVADCKGVVDHNYAAPGYYVATYIEAGEVIAQLEVLVE